MQQANDVKKNNNVNIIIMFIISIRTQ